MATKSFLKDITLKNRKDCSKLLYALERAQKPKIVPVKMCIRDRSFSLPLTGRFQKRILNDRSVCSIREIKS